MPPAPACTWAIVTWDSLSPRPFQPAMQSRARSEAGDRSVAKRTRLNMCISCRGRHGLRPEPTARPVADRADGEPDGDFDEDTNDRGERRARARSVESDRGQDGDNPILAARGWPSRALCEVGVRARPTRGKGRCKGEGQVPHSSRSVPSNDIVSMKTKKGLSSLTWSR